MVRLIDADGTQVGIVSNAEAMDKAEAVMDLVMMQTAKRRFANHGLRKYIFEAKKQKAVRRRS